MKKFLIFPFSFFVLLALSSSSIDPTNPMVGRWQQKIKGTTLLFNFRLDGTYDYFVNGKSYTSGNYYVRQDTAGISDSRCNANYFGTYKIDFYAPDSVRFRLFRTLAKTAGKPPSDWPWVETGSFPIR